MKSVWRIRRSIEERETCWCRRLCSLLTSLKHSSLASRPLTGARACLSGLALTAVRAGSNFHSLGRTNYRHVHKQLHMIINRSLKWIQIEVIDTNRNFKKCLVFMFAAAKAPSRQTWPLRSERWGFVMTAPLHYINTYTLHWKLLSCIVNLQNKLFWQKVLSDMQEVVLQPPQMWLSVLLSAALWSQDQSLTTLKPSTWQKLMRARRKVSAGLRVSPLKPFKSEKLSLRASLRHILEAAAQIKVGREEQ